MESQLKYKVFTREKSVDELVYNCNLWTSDFEFIKIEISFLKRLLITFPFKSSIPNLFEKLQLFVRDLEQSDTIRTTIHETINTHNQQLRNKIKLKKISYDNEYLNSFDDMAEEVLAYLEDYKKLKKKIYEYVIGMINT
ncbi:hypothetical protein [Lutibacter flavus]|uniref:Uncharacterized protein n=1 Tax=Lutibacter flavus TaxID=691689 RepID=A0A238VEL1_9FLAO|nr:hypothetical protein [Lutibacter flavus]SNR32686.1 hypothetical protein SAMN04488111_0360 [Lutibacter flavus]